MGAPEPAETLELVRAFGFSKPGCASVFTCVSVRTICQSLPKLSCFEKTSQSNRDCVCVTLALRFCRGVDCCIAMGSLEWGAHRKFEFPSNLHRREYKAGDFR